MADCSIGALGVLGPDHWFAGIVTERDLSWFVAQGRDARETKVEVITNDFPVVVEGPLNDDEALDRMRRARVRHLIVHEGRDFRIVSMRDFVMRGPGNPKRPCARDVMTSPAVACRDEAFFEEVAEFLAERDISGMPVIDAKGEVVGVISERDLAYALGGPMVRLALRRHNQNPLRWAVDLPREARRAKDIMTTPALVVTKDTDLEEVARIMRLNQVNRVPVVDDDRLIGVVTRGDVLGAIGHLEHPPVDLTRPPVLVGSAGLNPGTHQE
jgi:CBS domain-containing protein